MNGRCRKCGSSRHAAKDCEVGKKGSSPEKIAVAQSRGKGDDIQNVVRNAILEMARETVGDETTYPKAAALKNLKCISSDARSDGRFLLDSGASHFCRARRKG